MLLVGLSRLTEGFNSRENATSLKAALKKQCEDEIDKVADSDASASANAVQVFFTVLKSEIWQSKLVQSFSSSPWESPFTGIALLALQVFDVELRQHVRSTVRNNSSDEVLAVLFAPLFIVSRWLAVLQQLEEGGCMAPNVSMMIAVQEQVSKDSIELLEHNTCFNNPMGCFSMYANATKVSFTPPPQRRELTARLALLSLGVFMSIMVCCSSACFAFLGCVRRRLIAHSETALTPLGDIELASHSGGQRHNEYALLHESHDVYDISRVLLAHQPDGGTALAVISDVASHGIDKSSDIGCDGDDAHIEQPCAEAADDAHVSNSTMVDLELGGNGEAPIPGALPEQHPSDYEASRCCSSGQ